MSLFAVRPIVVQLPHSPVPDLGVEAELRYSPQDPFAVCLAFSDTDGPLEWYFGRELLEQGLHRPAGDCDVHVEPGPANAVLVTLGNRTWRSTVSIHGDDITAFLTEAHALIPAGTEHLHLDLDTLIHDLLN
ncbi:SsgA family sporulation/cell division regulator [Kitasatospora cineracea]